MSVEKKKQSKACLKAQQLPQRNLRSDESCGAANQTCELKQIPIKKRAGGGTEEEGQWKIRLVSPFQVLLLLPSTKVGASSSPLQNQPPCKRVRNPTAELKCKYIGHEASEHDHSPLLFCLFHFFKKVLVLCLCMCRTRYHLLARSRQCSEKFLPLHCCWAYPQCALSHALYINVKKTKSNEFQFRNCPP